MKKLSYFFIGLALLAILLFSPWEASSQTQKVRIGHFPNITHAQALIAHANGAFDKKFAGEAEVEWKIFNAGPSAIEAIFSGDLDIAYIGPSPAINRYVKSGGEALRVISSAASGGAGLVVRKDAGISTIEDFHQKRIASPQLGNTQDVALRSWLIKNGLKLKEVGGDVQVLPLSNADQQTLFLKKEIDGAWTVEPWVSLLIQKGEGSLFLDESSLWKDGRYATTLVIVRQKFLDEHPDLVKKFLEAHVELTDWINSHPIEAKQLIQEEIKKETTKELPSAILETAFKSIRFTYESLEDSVKEQAEAAFQAGFLKKSPDLSDLFDKKLLNEVLKK